MNLRRNLPLFALLALTAAALAILWSVRDAPWTTAPWLAVDALGAFFVFATLFGLALAAATGNAEALSWRVAVATAALLVAYGTALVPLLLAAFALLAFLSVLPRIRRLRLADSVPLVAAGLLGVGYGTLLLRGVVRYDGPAAGAALDGFVFWFVLLAAAAPLLPFARGAPREYGPIAALRLAWLYPLARLFSLSPWNQGWSFAAALFGGALALWAATSALAGEERARSAHLLVVCQLGLALAGFGLGTGAGLAAGCYALLVYGVLLAAANAPQPGNSASPSLLHWLLTPAVPFGAPFIATWMLLGAGVAGGVSLLGALAWLVALCFAVACALGIPWNIERRATIVLAGTSLALGVFAPVVVLLLIQPVIAQLQGGLSVYGDITIWPWVGLAAVDSSRRGVTALPSIAAAALMLVLAALAYLAVRLFDDTGATEAGEESPLLARSRTLLATLRHEVPWLAAPGEDRRSDDR